MPDSQFEAIQKRGNSENSRKRKRPNRSENSEKFTQEILEIQKIAEKVREAGRKLKYFPENHHFPDDNNKKSRKAAEEVMNVQESLKLSEATCSEQILEVANNSQLEDELMCNGMISNWCRNNGSDVKVIENNAGIKFYLPPNATFHIGNITDIENYATIHDVKFDVIIVDPPWICASVKRKKTYEMNGDVLDSLDFRKFSSPDSLIGIWITNRNGIKEELEWRFEKWDFETIGEWKWLKVTTQGEPVYDFENSRHKVPFETIIFGRPKKENVSEKQEEIDKSDAKFKKFPRKFTFSSVPMAVHSHKPPLYDLLEYFGVTFERPLELFARSLLPETHSVGFEPILLNSEKMFVKQL